MLTWFYVSSLSAAFDKSTTFDELLHLTAGYSSWKLDDFRMEPDNGNLPQRWAAVPLLFDDTKFPDLDQDAWRRSVVGTIGEQFFYNIGNDGRAMLLRGRAMIALFGVALGALVYLCARRFLGAAPALVSLGLYSFCPTVLANAALITSDMAVTLFFFASILCIWWVLHQVNWRSLLVGSLVMGCLFVAKFSSILIVPMGLFLIAIQLFSRQPTVVTFGNKTWQVRSRSRRLLLHVFVVAVHACVVWAVIWTFFDFRYDMFAKKTVKANSVGELVVVDRPTVTWDLLLKDSPVLEPIVNRMRDARILPEAYLYGFTETWRLAQARSGFLNGEYRVTGWREFFPYCLLVKTPLTLFILFSLALTWILRSWFRAGDNWRARAGAMRASCYRTAPLWVLFLVYWAVAISSHLNIGHRHLLPTYPPMLILAGSTCFWLASRSKDSKEQTSSTTTGDREVSRLLRWAAARRWPVVSCVVLFSVVLFAGESLWRWPNYLSYFNQLIGSPTNAYRHLIDSSLDWGQDLPALQRWLAKEGLSDSPNEKVYLSYFGTASPTYYGIQATLLPCYPGRSPTYNPEPLEAGTYCISATMLQSVYTTFRGPWSSHYEAGYKELASAVHEFEIKGPDERRLLIENKGEGFWAQAFFLYEQARLARLVSFLRQREPDSEINYSILIYRLQESDLVRALEGPPVELQDYASDEDKSSDATSH